MVSQGLSLEEKKLLKNPSAEQVIAALVHIHSVSTFGTPGYRLLLLLFLTGFFYLSKSTNKEKLFASRHDNNLF